MPQPWTLSRPATTGGYGCSMVINTLPSIHVCSPCVLALEGEAEVVSGDRKISMIVLPTTVQKVGVTATGTAG